jgi:hypothetical protein
MKFKIYFLVLGALALKVTPDVDTSISYVIYSLSLCEICLIPGFTSEDFSNISVLSAWGASPQNNSDFTRNVI